MPTDGQMNRRDRSYARTVQRLEGPQEPVSRPSRSHPAVDVALQRYPHVDRMTMEIAVELAKIAKGYRSVPIGKR